MAAVPFCPAAGVTVTVRFAPAPPRAIPRSRTHCPEENYAVRFMIIVKATPKSEAGVMPEEKMFEVMAAYHEELARAPEARAEFERAASLAQNARGHQLLLARATAETTSGSDPAS